MIHIDNLSFSYGYNRPLFDQVSLALPPGSIYGLLGKNGAGKSSLLKIISGLLFPKGGRLTVDGYRPSDRFPQFLQEVYFISEEFELPAISQERFIKLYSPFYPRFDHGLFQMYSGEFQLPAEPRISTFSYGQKKKFLLSFGLATDCKLVILDEPTNGLDIPSKSQFRKVVANAIHEERTFIISTHQVRDMENLIDPIIILDEGEIVFFQNFDQISQRISIGRQAELPTNANVIFAEQTLGGYTYVKENTAGEETNINLEVLFKAVISNKEKMYEIFNQTAGANG